MIHPSAIIDSKAELADDVEVSPFVVIGSAVRIDSGTWIGPHTVIQGPTDIGRDNRIYQFSSIGEQPQDKKYAGEATRLIIGHRNVIREYCTFNRGTIQDQGQTVIGNDNWIMAYVHIAHDCIVGNQTIFANGATLAGHVVVQDYAILGGFCLVHQFCRVGQYAFTGMGTALSRDVPPYVLVGGNPTSPHGINVEGLKRHGFHQEKIQHLKTAYRLLYRSSYRMDRAINVLKTKLGQYAEVNILIDFLKNSNRSIIR